MLNTNNTNTDGDITKPLDQVHAVILKKHEEIYKKNESLKKELESTNKDLIKYKELYEDLKEKEQEFNNHTSRLEEDIIKLNETIFKLEQEKIKPNETIFKLEEDIIKLNEEVKKLKKEKIQLVEQNYNREQKLDELSTKTSNLQIEINKISELEKQNDELKKQNNELHLKLDELSTKNSKFQIAIDKIHELEKQKNEVEEQNNELKLALDDQTKRTLSSEKLRKETLSFSDQKDKQLDIFQKQFYDLRSQLDQLKSEKNQKIENLKLKIIKLKEENENLQQFNSSLSSCYLTQVDYQNSEVFESITEENENLQQFNSSLSPYDLNQLDYQNSEVFESITEENTKDSITIEQQNTFTKYFQSLQAIAHSAIFTNLNKKIFNNIIKEQFIDYSLKEITGKKNKINNVDELIQEIELEYASMLETDSENIKKYNYMNHIYNQIHEIYKNYTKTQNLYNIIWYQPEHSGSEIYIFETLYKDFQEINDILYKDNYQDIELENDGNTISHQLTITTNKKIEINKKNNPNFYNNIIKFKLKNMQPIINNMFEDIQENFHDIDLNKIMKSFNNLKLEDQNENSLYNILKEEKIDIHDKYLKMIADIMFTKSRIDKTIVPFNEKYESAIDNLLDVNKQYLKESFPFLSDNDFKKINPIFQVYYKNIITELSEKLNNLLIERMLLQIEQDKFLNTTYHDSVKLEVYKSQCHSYLKKIFQGANYYGQQVSSANAILILLAYNFFTKIMIDSESEDLQKTYQILAGLTSLLVVLKNFLPALSNSVNLFHNARFRDDSKLSIAKASVVSFANITKELASALSIFFSSNANAFFNCQLINAISSFIYADYQLNLSVKNKKHNNNSNNFVKSLTAVGITATGVNTFSILASYYYQLMKLPQAISLGAFFPVHITSHLNQVSKISKMEYLSQYMIYFARIIETYATAFGSALLINNKFFSLSLLFADSLKAVFVEEEFGRLRNSDNTRLKNEFFSHLTDYFNSLHLHNKSHIGYFLNDILYYSKNYNKKFTSLKDEVKHENIIIKDISDNQEVVNVLPDSIDNVIMGITNLIVSYFNFYKKDSINEQEQVEVLEEYNELEVITEGEEKTNYLEDTVKPEEYNVSETHPLCSTTGSSISEDTSRTSSSSNSVVTVIPGSNLFVKTSNKKTTNNMKEKNENNQNNENNKKRKSHCILM